MATTLTHTSARGTGMTGEEKFVIFASSLGTVFEWYDFYLYAILAPFFAALFFPTGNDTAALLSAFATYAAGFLVRPFGALVFGRIGDLVGRKYTFLVTIIVMGASTFAGRPAADLRLDRLAGADPAGHAAPAAGPRARRRIRRRRDLRRRAFAAAGERGYATSWIQTTATLGLLPVAARHRRCAATTWLRKAFADWGWRIPFLVSVVLLIFSVYIRLKLNESPVFQRMKEEGKGSKAPLTDSFLRYPNNKYVLLALLGATAGQGVVWYTGQFYALFFLTSR